MMRGKTKASSALWVWLILLLLPLTKNSHLPVYTMRYDFLTCHTFFVSQLLCIFIILAFCVCNLLPGLAPFYFVSQIIYWMYIARYIRLPEKSLHKRYLSGPRTKTSHLLRYFSFIVIFCNLMSILDQVIVIAV